VSNSRCYNNVSREKLKRLKGYLLSELQKVSGYTIAKCNLPDGDNVRWHVLLKGKGKNKADLDFMVALNRNNARDLTINVLKLPSFISVNRFFREIDKIIA
jgi:hypothetical protein